MLPFTATLYNQVHEDAPLPPLPLEAFPALQKHYRQRFGKELALWYLFGRPTVYVITPQ